jgi:hypothetical protein
LKRNSTTKNKEREDAEEWVRTATAEFAMVKRNENTPRSFFKKKTSPPCVSMVLHGNLKWSSDETSDPLLSPPLPRTARTRILPCYGSKNAGFKLGQPLYGCPRASRRCGGARLRDRRRHRLVRGPREEDR